MHQSPSYQLIILPTSKGERHTVSRDLYFLMNRVESARFAPVISLNSEIICVSRCLFAFVDCALANCNHISISAEDIPW